mmetsp:Transcript_15248/g.24762  ORF Transcript_15248/g.24762 Transcript_15248/m.24762 type:complete len:416 (+) Transcript_15248:41-1288(+)|eukprot:CAMPEP_0203791518 /NCGR_PEP_ID=MMETSP0100_2-20121128/4683_1 /ASSEMBLY_ACC=CAM_ASM_000210 /TAXON_ID=96639 /ORGANISM=" , Strain NY0313808BC1" /LENGTH=415 /DNA_ID=CAMNT_0050694853 /DNA_START=184 /DNA_END=1431 /DNA_ORIENTATION=+
MSSLVSECLLRFSDVLFLFSLFLFHGHVKNLASRARRGELMAAFPALFLLVACVNTLVNAAGIFYPGSAHVKLIAQALSQVPVAEKGSPITLVSYLVTKVDYAYDALFAVVLFIQLFSLLMSDCFGRLSSMLASLSTRGEREEIEKQIQEVEVKRREQLDKSKSKKTKQHKGEKQSSNTAPPEKVIQEKTPAWLNGMFLIFGLLSIVLTIAGFLRVPKPSRPTTLISAIPLFGKCLPYRFGCLSLLEVLFLLRTNVWKSLKPGEKWTMSNVGHGLYFRIFSLVVFANVWIREANYDVQGLFMKSSMAKKAHICIAGMQLIVLVVSILPAYIRKHVMISALPFACIGVFFALVDNQGPVSMSLSELKVYVTYGFLSVSAAGSLFAGPTAMGFLMMALVVLLYVHQDLAASLGVERG